MASAKQASVLPTRKLSVGATIAPIFALYAAPVTAELWGSIAPALLSGPETTNLVSALCGSLVGVAVAWWIPDAPNQVMA
jgi:hypothetical protein